MVLKCLFFSCIGNDNSKDAAWLFILTYYPSAGNSVDMCSASANGELNIRSENQGGLNASQAGRSYLSFPTTASAHADLLSAWVMHESALRLNLYDPMLCAEEMCSTHVFIIILKLPS